MSANLEPCQRCQELEKLLMKAFAEIEFLKKRVKELEDKLNTNSSNSSKPPSQDPFRASKKKTPTGKQQGGQKGHKGHSRQLISVDQVKQVYDLRPSLCPECLGDQFDPDVLATEVRQVVELPDLPPEVIQYNITTCKCSGCGKHVRADIPKEAKFGFGPRLMAFTTLLSGEFRLSKRNVVALVSKLGIRICSGSVCKIQARAAAILEAPFEEIKKDTLVKGELNADESPWKTLAEKKWIWIGASKDSVFFKIHPRRSSEAFREIFVGFNGTLTTDRFGAYNSHEGRKQVCLAHADRDFEKILSREGLDKWIGERLKGCLKEIFNLWHQFKNKEFDRRLLIQKFEEGLKDEMRMLLKIGAIGVGIGNKTHATCLDFYDRFENLWTFIYEERVEPTNNDAERGLRHAVIWRKLSFGTQSEIGERFVERIMTVALTLKMRAHNSFEYLTACFRSFIHGAQAPPLPA
jgi:transposase